jgi:hypothetical protein
VEVGSKARKTFNTPRNTNASLTGKAIAAQWRPAAPQYPAPRCSFGLIPLAHPQHLRSVQYLAGRSSDAAIVERLGYRSMRQTSKLLKHRAQGQRDAMKT